MLEHHAHFRADGLDVFQVVGQLDAVHDDLPFLVLFQPVDAPDQRGFTGTGRSADHDFFLSLHFQVDVLQYVKITIPFVEVLHLNDGVGCIGHVRFLKSSVNCVCPYPAPVPVFWKNWTWKNIPGNTLKPQTGTFPWKIHSTPGSGSRFWM